MNAGQKADDKVLEGRVAEESSRQFGALTDAMDASADVVPSDETIEERVARELRKQLWKLATMVCVTNAVALTIIALMAWRTASGIAREVAASTTREVVSGKMDQVDRLARNVDERLTIQSTMIDGLFIQVGDAQGQLERTRGELQPFVDAVAAATSSTPEHVTEVLAEVNRLSEPGRQLLDDVAVLRAWMPDAKRDIHALGQTAQRLKFTPDGLEIDLGNDRWLRFKSTHREMMVIYRDQERLKFHENGSFVINLGSDRWLHFQLDGNILVYRKGVALWSTGDNVNNWSTGVIHAR